MVALLADGTSFVGEKMSLSWLWWVVGGLVGLVVLAFVVGKLFVKPPKK